MYKSRILVVDDETVITMQLEEFLVSMGCEVVGKASSGEEAVSKASELRPCLIIMDIIMPGKLDGIDAAKAIKEEMGIPVIFLTAYGGEQLIERAKEIEPLGYIVKPFEKRVIAATIKIALYKIDAEKMRKKKMEELNTSLRVMLGKSDEIKERLEDKVFINVKEQVIPYIEKLRNSVLDQNQAAYLDTLRSNIEDIASPFSQILSSGYINLSSSELKVASLIKDGKTTKDISQLLGLSISTIDSYRKSIRKKLNITNRKVNLQAFLLSL